MQPPGNYNSESMVIKVDPNRMYDLATTAMIDHAETVGDALGRINDVWSNLTVGWVGTTADEAQDFNDRWSAAMTGLFGTQDDPSTGAINKIAQAVADAATNYGVAEDTNVQNLQSFLELGGGSSTTPQGPGRDQNQPPVTETNQPS